MKKAFILLLSLILCFSITGIAEEPYVRQIENVISTPNNALAAKTPACCIWVFDSKLYTVTREKRVVSVPVPTPTNYSQPLETVVDLADYPHIIPGDFFIASCQLVDDGHNLYLLDYDCDKIYRITGSQIDLVTGFDFISIVEGAYKFRYPIIWDAHLYLIRTGERLQLLRFPFTTGKGEVVDTGEYTFSELMPYKNGQWLGLVANTGLIVALDPTTMTVTEQIANIAEKDVAGVAYDTATDKIYCSIGLELYRLDKGELTWITHFGMDSLSIDQALIWQNRYTALDWYGIFFASLPDVSEPAGIHP